MSDPAILARALGKDYGDFTAVRDLSFDVAEGEVLALLGPNGAGKTTTLRMLASILAPTRGSARVAGFDVLRQPEEVRRSIGFLTEHHGLYTRMRAQEYLRFFGLLYGVESHQADRRASELLAQLGMQDVNNRSLNEFSKGMRQKLALARALLHEPAVLLLDEPTSAMDPASARLVRDAIGELRTSLRTIVVSTHNLAEAESMADRIAIIQAGQVVALGTSSELKRQVLGEPEMELRLAGGLDGAVQLLPGGLRDVRSGSGWIRYRTKNAAQDNPRVLQAMSAAGLQPVTLAEVPRTLEDAYLRIVRADAPEAAT
jgi:ABC-2 type transport system ATP-binding protein